MEFLHFIIKKNFNTINLLKYKCKDQHKLNNILSSFNLNIYSILYRGKTNYVFKVNLTILTIYLQPIFKYKHRMHLKKDNSTFLSPL